MALSLSNLRLGFACKERWEDMVGDDRVRACRGCDRDVYNLSAMTREEAEGLLAGRGLTPCVRFYRRPDGTVMTTDCPTGRPERRRLAVVASSLAAGAVLVAPATTNASPDPPPDETVAPATTQVITIEETYLQGIPLSSRELHVDDYEVGIIVDPSPPTRPRPRVDWSIWGRLGLGLHRQNPNVLARGLTAPEASSSATWEGALAADVTVGVARDGNLRVGAWAEVRTTSGPVVGGELVVQGLPPHPDTSRIGAAGSIVLRAGGNARVFTAALGFGYVGSFRRSDPWIRWARHLVGARIIASVNRSLDDPREWSATFGIEVEPLGVLHAVLDLATDR
jgi:hypothetical protein